MKQRLKGLLALVLSLTMVLSMVTVSTASQPSDSGSAPTEYHVSVGGVGLTSANISNYTGVSFVPADGDNPATLTLNGFDGGAISASNDLTLVLEGENTITATSDKGISVIGNLTIEGSNGKVTATGVKYGIYADTVTITGGSVLANSTNDDGWGIYGGSNVTIKDGAKVVAKAGDNGIGIGTIYSTDSASSASTIVISGEGTEVEAGCKTGLSAYEVTILENSKLTVDDATTSAIVCGALKFSDFTHTNNNWYQWKADSNPVEKSSDTNQLEKNEAAGAKILTIGKITYTVAFNANGHGTAPSAQSGIAAGGKVTEPNPAPTAAGWTFGGWYEEQSCTSKWDFATDTVTADITLYAKWTENSGGVPGNTNPYPPIIYNPTPTPEPEVTTPDTFDGGIASAVVVTILSATGGAWLAKKKD